MIQETLSEGSKDALKRKFSYLLIEVVKCFFYTLLSSPPLTFSHFISPLPPLVIFPHFHLSDFPTSAMLNQTIYPSESPGPS